MENGYPILLRLEGRRCLVVGGGTVAARKVVDLLEAGARVTVISPMLTETLALMIGRFDLCCEEYSADALADLHPLLVFAATDSPAVNWQVAADARALGALVDVVDSADAGDFSSMAALRREAVTIAIGTGGASPALAAHLRKRLEETIGAEYGTLARWLADLRPLVREQLASDTDRAAFWRAVLDSPVLDLLRDGKDDQARQLLDSLLAGAS